MKHGYKPLRQCYRTEALGMNAPAHARFSRVRGAFGRDSCYYGDRGEWWIVAAITRDSGSLDRSNWAVLWKRLTGLIATEASHERDCEPEETITIERATHWACGWVDYMIVRGDDRAALREAIMAHSAIEDYPVLDEEHWSELQYNEFWELAKCELSQYSKAWERVLMKIKGYDNTGNGDDSADWAAIEAAREVLKAQQEKREIRRVFLADWKGRSAKWAALFGGKPTVA